MKYIKLFEDFFPWQHKMTDEEYQKVWNYLCYYVFPNEKVELINQVVVEGVLETEFLDFQQKINNPNYKPLPKFQIVNEVGSSITGLSSEFQRELNNQTYNSQNCEGWKHLFVDVMNSLQSKRTRYYPSYQYDFNLMVVDNWKGYTKGQLRNMLNGEKWASSNEITEHLKESLYRYSKHFDLDLKINVNTWGTRGVIGLNTYVFEVRLTDLDFEPKPDSEIWK